MSSIMRARNGLTGRWKGPEVIGGSFLELKVAGPSMLVIGCPDRHALPHITSSKMRRPRCVLPPARAGSFYHPERTSGAGIKRQILSTSGANHTLGTRIGRRLSVESECGAVA